MRRTTIIILIIAAFTAFAGCTREGKDGGRYLPYNTKMPKRIGVVLSAPGASGAGTNEAVVAGVKRAAFELDAEYKILYPSDPVNNIPGDLVNNMESLRYLAENGYDMVVAVGRGMQDDLNRVAPEYKDIRFVIFEGEVEQQNVASIRVNADDGAFLAGIAAASLTRSNLVGYVGGSMTSDRQAENSFARGVQYVNTSEGKEVKVNVIYAGVTEEAVNDPARGKDLANSLFWTGSDVVFSGAGKLGSGVANAASENRKIAICNDLQLMQAFPWNVYATMVIKPEMAVYEQAKKILTGKFNPGRNGYGFAEGAVEFLTSEAAPPEIAAKMTSVKESLQQGKNNPYNILVPEGLVTQINQLPVDYNKQPAASSPGANQGPNPQNRWDRNLTGDGAGTGQNGAGTEQNSTEP